MCTQVQTRTSKLSPITTNKQRRRLKQACKIIMHGKSILISHFEDKLGAGREHAAADLLRDDVPQRPQRRVEHEQEARPARQVLLHAAHLSARQQGQG